MNENKYIIDNVEFTINTQLSLAETERVSQDITKMLTESVNAEFVANLLSRILTTTKNADSVDILNAPGVQAHKIISDYIELKKKESESILKSLITSMTDYITLSQKARV